MQIFYENSLNKIKEIIEKRAKYQKVMLLFDETISNIKIANIHNDIKELCIYNQMEISKITENELFNGYKVVIYACGVNSYLKYNFPIEDFVNIFYPQDEGVLPFFLIDSRPLNGENYMLFDEHRLDVNLTISLYFNRFYNYFKNLLSFSTQFASEFEEIYTHELENNLQSLDDTTDFLDIKL